ncbi:MAG: YbhB/YbcL family Raf kinase inhibitor-like protein [Haloferacaceae archaeon]
MALRLTSPAFDDGGAIPRKYGYEEQNVNPPLSIAGVPDGAESLVLLMDDPDAVEPAGKVWDHWTVFDVPPDLAEIPEGWSPSDAVEGQNDYGGRGYGGPNPPDREHTYRFRLYALDTALSLGEEATKDHVETAMSGHVLAETQLEGTYAP